MEQSAHKILHSGNQIQKNNAYHKIEKQIMIVSIFLKLGYYIYLNQTDTGTMRANNNW